MGNCLTGRRKSDAAKGNYVVKTSRS